MNFKLIIQTFRNKSYNYLNVAGLMLAFGVFIIVSLYVFYEFQGDKFHQNYENIVRLNRITKVGTPIPLTIHFKDKFPEIKKYARFSRMYDPIVKNNEQLVKLKTGYFSDKSAFDVFSFDLLYGTIDDDFITPFSISISESLSKKLFGGINPVGEVIKYNNEFNFTVKAVFKDLPSNSHLQVDALASIESMGSMSELEKYPYESFNRWGCMNYLLLAPNASIPQLEEKLSSLIKEVMNDEKFAFGLQPFSEIYFDGNRSMDDCKHSNKQTLLILLSIAIIIIVLACVNYINLCTAQILSRSNEIGVKKMLGASKFSLIQRFIKESVLISMISMFAGFFISYLLSLLFSNLLPKDLFAENIFAIKPILIYISLSIIVGFLAGLYPAVYYSSAKELNILKGINRNIKGHGFLRKGLIIVQFAASIILIICTLFVYKQLYLFKNVDPGFPKEQLMYLAYNELESSPKMNSFLEEISQNSNIKSITQTNTIPGNIFYQNVNRIENEDKILYDLAANREYFETMELKLVEGRLPAVNPEKRKNELVLNQTAVKMLEWEDPIGRTDIWGREVVGVVEDFNYMSMHHAILPLMIRFDPYFNYATLKINTKNLNQTISLVESKWIQFFPSSMFEYHFLDDSFEQLYQSEIKFGKLAIYLSFIALLVSLMGMAGLVSFVTKRRIKEIGIRKVNGARISEILTMLNKDFIKWVAIAFIVACPIAYFAMNKWLENFAYKTSLSWWIFALAGVLALGIALFTVSWQSWRAATRNPVEALRYE